MPPLVIVEEFWKKLSKCYPNVLMDGHVSCYKQNSTPNWSEDSRKQIWPAILQASVQSDVKIETLIGRVCFRNLPLGTKLSQSPISDTFALLCPATHVIMNSNPPKLDRSIRLCTTPSFCKQPFVNGKVASPKSIAGDTTASNNFSRKTKEMCLFNKIIKIICICKICSKQPANDRQI